MIVSVNWLKEYVDIELSIADLAKLIGARLVEVENVIDLGEKYRNVTVVRVMSCRPVEGSDHLNLTTIDDNHITRDIERDSNGYIQVVCGAPNISEGQMVAWLPPKTIVPNTYEKEPFTLESRALKGYISHGMIASGHELDLSDDHNGILVLPGGVTPGSLLRDVLKLDDYLLDIENKSLTHRPDTFGIIGFAREVAGILGQPFKTPDWLNDLERQKADSTLSNDLLEVIIDDKVASERYLAVVMTGADCKRNSPLAIQSYLARVGVRPINAVVDVTNYCMMLTGQPLHAFDYDKLLAVSGGRRDIHVRYARNGEKLELLGRKTIEMSTSDIVIAAGEHAIALAGAMGGEATAIDENTKRIVIESATFNLYDLRATQMRHGIFSEAVTRFTKGLSAEMALPVVKQAVHLLNDWAGATQESVIFEDYPEKLSQTSIRFDEKEVNRLLGSNFTKFEIAKTLSNVEFDVSESSDWLSATAPYWRKDIHITEDIIEEIGRLNGFDNLEPTTPLRRFEAISSSPFDAFRSALRRSLARAGSNEVLTYSFVHGSMIENSAQEPSNSYKIVNSISPQLQYYRQSLTPSLLDLVHSNIRQGYDKFALFEINKAHDKSLGLTDEGVPVESEKLAFVIADKKSEKTAFYYAKKYFTYLVETLSLDVELKAMTGEVQSDMMPFDPSRSQVVLDRKIGKTIGVIGEYKISVKKAFKLPPFAAGFEIDTIGLMQAVSASRYEPTSKFQSSERDVCYRVGDGVNYQALLDVISGVIKKSPLDINYRPLDIYKSEGSSERNITLRYKIVASDHTLTGYEIDSLVSSINQTAVDSLGVSIV
jgi:phenylalanyl-tRNA synthetase beta chain